MEMERLRGGCMLALMVPQCMREGVRLGLGMLL